MKQAQLPDGRVLEFPPETHDSVMDQVVQRELGVQQEPEVPVEQIVLQHLAPLADFLMQGIQTLVAQSARTEQALLQLAQATGQQGSQMQAGLLRVAEVAAHREPEPPKDTRFEEGALGLLNEINQALRAEKEIVTDAEGAAVGMRIAPPQLV